MISVNVVCAMCVFWDGVGFCVVVVDLVNQNVWRVDWLLSISVMFWIRFNLRLFDMKLEVWIVFCWFWFSWIVWYSAILSLDALVFSCWLFFFVLSFLVLLYSVGVNIFKFVSVATWWNIFGLCVGLCCVWMLLFIVGRLSDDRLKVVIFC